MLRGGVVTVARYRVRATVSFDAWMAVEAGSVEEAEGAAEDRLSASPELVGRFFADADEKAVCAHVGDTEEVGERE